MNKLLSRWRSITIGVLLAAYLILVVFMQQPVTTFIYFAVGWILLLILTFLGTFIGVAGVLLQLVTHQNDIAYPFYKTAYRLGTKNPTILASYGLLLMRRNETKEAIACFDRALDSTGHFLSHKTLMCNRAIALWQQGDLDEAIHQYNEALRRFGSDDQKYFTDPSFDDEAVKTLVSDNTYFYPSDYTTLGYFYILQGDMEKADFMTKAALEKDSSYGAAYDNFGQIAFMEERFDEAEGHFEKSLELNPNQVDSLYFSGRLAAMKGNTDLARERLTKASTMPLDGLNATTKEMIEAALAEL